MKKRLVVLMAIVLLFGGISTAWALDNQPVIAINGQIVKGLETINKDGRLYIPLRAVAEALNCKVEWTESMIFIDPAYNRPNIEGVEKFTRAVNQALDLLQDKAPAHYAMVCQNLKGITIRENIHQEPDFITFAESSGTWCDFSPAFVNDEERFVPVYIAGIIVHEACHICYTRAGGDMSDINKNELIAYQTGIDVLKMLEAPEWMILNQEKAKSKYQ